MPKKQTTNHRIQSAKKRIHKRVKLAVIPHRANQYRPHAIRRYGILAIVVFVFAVQIVYNSLTGGTVLGAQAHITPNGLLKATNAARAAHGEDPLVINTALTKAARLKVQNMFDEQYWAHDAPDGTTPWHWFNVVGYDYENAGENLAKDFTTSSGTVAAWMASPTHRANILKAAYTDVGFATMNGTLDGQNTTIVVALYGNPEPAVQGASITTDAPSLSAALAPLTRFNLGTLSLTPAAISSIVVLVVAAVLAIIAHLYRRKLPPELRRSWYRHHGIYKAIGFASLAVVVVFMYGGAGQI